MEGKRFLQSLQTVFAYTDDGLIIAVPTRWSQRKVFCKDSPAQNDASGRLYAVKYRRDPTSTAAAISEVISHALLKMLGLRTLDAVLVEVSPHLSQSYRQSGILDYAIDDGLNFATRLRLDFMPGPIMDWDFLARPEELIFIWAADCWLMNLDRSVYGNILLEQDNRKWHLIPADQSDCLLGSSSFSDGSYASRSRFYSSAPHLPMLERALLEKGPAPLQKIIGLIHDASNRIPEAVARVPSAWWSRAGTTPHALEACLRERASRIAVLVQLDKWKNMPYGTDGITLLDL